MILKISTILLLVVMGLGNLWIAIDGAKDSIGNVINGHASNHWPVADGYIEKSQTVPTRKAFRPEISYQYEVDGNRYSGNRVEFTAYAYSLSDSNMITSAFPSGYKAMIYYKPSHPQNSTLIPGVKFESYMSAAGCLFWFFPAFFILYMIYPALIFPASEYKQGYKDAFASRFRNKANATEMPNKEDPPDQKPVR